MTTEYQLIDKEAVKDLHFPTAEVLTEKAAMLQRMNDLDRALSLGHLEHGKIKIFFEDDISKKAIETTIWGVTDNRVILKQGLVIPVNRIYKIV